MPLNRLIIPSWPRRPVTALSYSRMRGGRALVIMTNGAVVLEDYHNGHVSTDLHDVASGTKTYSGDIAKKLTLEGWAGGPTSLGSLVKDVLTEWNVPGARGAMTLRRLLCLTGGCEADAGGDPGVQWTYQQNVDQANVPNLAVGTFQYGRTPFLIFGAYANRLLNANGFPGVMAVANYLDNRILAPINASIGSWQTIPASGEPKLQAGASLTALAWARYGEYMRTSAHSAELSAAGPDYAAYGVTRWRSVDRPVLTLNGQGTANFPGGGYMAAGSGKSRLIVMPDIGMVAARFGVKEEEHPLWRDVDFVNLLRSNPF